jgi:hypothetical protein
MIVVEMPMSEDEKAAELLVEEPPLVSSKLSRQARDTIRRRCLRDPMSVALYQGYKQTLIRPKQAKYGSKKRWLEQQDSSILPEERSIIIQVWTESNKKRRGAGDNKQRKLVAQVDDNFFNSNEMEEEKMTTRSDEHVDNTTRPHNTRRTARGNEGNEATNNEAMVVLGKKNNNNVASAILAMKRMQMNTKAAAGKVGTSKVAKKSAKKSTKKSAKKNTVTKKHISTKKNTSTKKNARTTKKITNTIAKVVGKKKNNTKIDAKAPKKTAMKLKLLSEETKKECATLIDHWMTNTVAIFDEAGVVPPRQKWANDLNDLRVIDPMLYAWYSCCGMMISMKNRDENVSTFMALLRESNMTPYGIREQSLLLGAAAVKRKVLGMAKDCFGFYNMVSANIMLLAKDFEFKMLWTRSWQEIEDAVVGLGPKCSIILYEIWHPESSPGIAVDIHVLTLAKSLGIFDYDSSDQQFFQNTLESIVDQKKWPEVNRLFGGLFQYLHLSRGQEGCRVIEKAAKKVGAEASTMLKLFETTKRLIALKTMQANIKDMVALQGSLTRFYKESMTVE